MGLEGKRTPDRFYGKTGQARVEEAERVVQEITAIMKDTEKKLAATQKSNVIAMHTSVAA